MRHDLESFVYLLYYVVLRYRPIAISNDAPVDSDPRTELLNDMRSLFDTATVNSLNRLVATGKVKATFLTNLNGAFLPASNLGRFITPAPLLRLLFDARRLFSGVYSPEPTSFPGARPNEQAKYQKELARWEEARTKAEKKLTSAALKCRDRCIQTIQFLHRNVHESEERLRGRHQKKPRVSSHSSLDIFPERSYCRRRRCVP